MPEKLTSNRLQLFWDEMSFGWPSDGWEHKNQKEKKKKGNVQEQCDIKKKRKYCMSILS